MPWRRYLQNGTTTMLQIVEFRYRIITSAVGEGFCWHRARVTVTTKVTTLTCPSKLGVTANSLLPENCHATVPLLARSTASSAWNVRASETQEIVLCSGRWPETTLPVCLSCIRSLETGVSCLQLSDSTEKWWIYENANRPTISDGFRWCMNHFHASFKRCSSVVQFQERNVPGTWEKNTCPPTPPHPPPPRLLEIASPRLSK